MENTNRDSFYVVSRWMTTELGLKGNDLIVFAIIYSFSQDVNQFQGTAGYIAELANIEKRTVMRTLKKLTQNGLIKKTTKTINGVSLCDYMTCIKKFKKCHTPCQNVIGGMTNCHGGMTKCHRGYDKLSPHNIIDNINDNIIDNNINTVHSNSIRKENNKREELNNNIQTDVHPFDDLIDVGEDNIPRACACTRACEGDEEVEDIWKYEDDIPEEFR